MLLRAILWIAAAMLVHMGAQVHAFKVEPVGIRDDGVIVGAEEETPVANVNLAQRQASGAHSRSYFVEFYNNHTHAAFYADLKAHNISYDVDAVFRDPRIFYGVGMSVGEKVNASVVGEFDGVQNVWVARDTMEGKTVGFDGWLGMFGGKVA